MTRPEALPDPAVLAGTWIMVRAELEGEAAPELVTHKTVLELDATRYAVIYDGQVMDRGTYELGGMVDARVIVLKGDSGTNAGRRIPGIYQLMGDRLRICYGLDGTAPAAYATSPGSRRYLATYRRARP